jgi:hypothetical protein
MRWALAVLRSVGGVLDRPVAYIDEKLDSMRIISGLVLVIIGGWFISLAFNYPVLWYFHILGILALFIGLLYLFLPGWLKALSTIADQSVFFTDDFVFAAPRAVGIALLIAAVYIFYFVYMSVR